MASLRRARASGTIATCRLIVVAVAVLAIPARAQDGMYQEQAQERREMQNMRGEMGDIKSEINDALHQMDQVGTQVNQSQNVHEVHLFVKRTTCELAPGINVECLTYNGKLPGPTIRVPEGERIRVVLHNLSDVPTSLLFQGLITPQKVGGLPHKDGGLVAPGQTYAYQFVPKQAGTYWYHPQVPQSEQKALGLVGVLVVDPASQTKSFEKELVVVVGDLVARTSQPRAARANGVAMTAQPPTGKASGAATFLLMNGKTAPGIPAIELHEGERVHMRVINAGQVPIPLHLSGHRFEVVAVNGSDPLEPHVFRDTITLNPSDRYDLEFTANNPGVWSLASDLYEQSTQDGRFPGGIACVVKY